MTHRPWTRKEEWLLADLRAAGRTLAQIGAALGRTATAVRKRAARIDAPKLWPRRLAYLHVFRERLPLREAARRLGVRPDTVKKYRWRLRRRAV